MKVNGGEWMGMKYVNEIEIFMNEMERKWTFIPGNRSDDWKW
jgi:hypothetical protein